VILSMCVCLSVRTTKPKRLKLQSPNLPREQSMTSPRPPVQKVKGQVRVRDTEMNGKTENKQRRRQRQNITQVAQLSPVSTTRVDGPS